MDWQTFGHKGVKNTLERQLFSANLPQTYLFTGPRGLGKQSLALEFARKILRAENLPTHPDFALLSQDGEITMESAVTFMAKLPFKPFVGQKKVAIINDAQNLNPQSSNALLKTLEEPSPSGVIILVASGRLLPTIVSRCQVLNFSLFSAGDLSAFAQSLGHKPVQEILDLSFGRPARLKRFLEDRDYFSEQQKILRKYREITKLSVGEKLLAIGDFADVESQQLSGRFENWLFWQAGNLRFEPQDFPKVRALMDAVLGLKMNKNKKLVLQSLFLKI